ncbi:MAG: hypothetical protein MRK01_16295 [Candidatus Scalindua sp.]|nr:hypothetical protein [Candidatus Scalindua sp.]
MDQRKNKIKAEDFSGNLLSTTKPVPYLLIRLKVLLRITLREDLDRGRRKPLFLGIELWKDILTKN